MDGCADLVVLKRVPHDQLVAIEDLDRSLLAHPPRPGKPLLALLALRQSLLHQIASVVLLVLTGFLELLLFELLVVETTAFFVRHVFWVFGLGRWLGFQDDHSWVRPVWVGAGTGAGTGRCGAFILFAEREAEAG